MFLTIVTFLFVLGLLVIVHEAGHFVTARRAGIKVDEFGFGLPPRAIGFYKNDNGKWKIVGPRIKEKEDVDGKVIWSLNWIPLGGFVKIKGENGEEAQDPDSFGSKGVWQRIWVLSAGVTMNIVLAAVLLTIGLTIGSPQFVDDDLPKFAKVEDERVLVVEVLEGTPAAQAGLELGDSIVSVDGQSFSEIISLQEYVADKVGQEMEVVINRDGSEIIDTLAPMVIEETGKGGFGVALMETGIVSYPWYVAPYYGVKETLTLIVGIISGFYMVIKSLFVSGGLGAEVYGPVGIANLVGDAARLGILYLLQFTAVLSVIIAVINFLPFPALDGGRVVFLLIEGIRKKPVNQKIEAIVHSVGFLLLMLLMVLVTYRDIAKIFAG